MKKIKNVSLLEESKKIEEEILNEKRIEIMVKIRSVYGGIHSSKGTVKNLQTQLDKATAKLEKLQKKLSDIKNEDWDVFEEEKESKKGDNQE